jgi:hypothetical protein
VIAEASAYKTALVSLCRRFQSLMWVPPEAIAAPPVAQPGDCVKLER